MGLLFNDVKLSQNSSYIQYEQSQNTLVEQGNELSNLWKDTSQNDESAVPKIDGMKFENYMLLFFFGRS